MNPRNYFHRLNSVHHLTVKDGGGVSVTRAETTQRLSYGVRHTPAPLVQTARHAPTLEKIFSLLDMSGATEPQALRQDDRVVHWHAREEARCTSRHEVWSDGARDRHD